MGSNKHERFLAATRATMNNPYYHQRGIGNMVLRTLMKGGMNYPGNASIWDVPNNDVYTGLLRPPWPPETGRELIHGNQTFVVNEDFFVGEDDTGDEVGYFNILLGSPKRRNCVILVLSSDTDYKVANIQGLSYYPNCSISGNLPGNGAGAKMLMAVMKRYLKERDITTAFVIDNAFTTRKGSYTFRVSDHYFLAHGEPYYHRYKLYPVADMDVYVRVIIAMKKITWGEIPMSLELRSTYEALALGCDPTLKGSDKATNWFASVWAKDESYLARTGLAVYTELKKIFGLSDIDPAITLLWSGELYTSAELDRRVQQILLAYPEEDRQLFLRSTREELERKRCEDM
jgi:hypothetical protein